MTFKYNLSETLTCNTMMPAITGVVHARTDYADTVTEPAYQMRWRDALGRMNSVWIAESQLEHVVPSSSSSPPQ